MKLKTTKISDLMPHSKNCNQHPEEQLTELENSLDQFEQVKNIVVWNGKVIAGNGLLEAVKRQGKDTIEVQDVSHWSEEKAIKYMIADNRLPELAIMDDDLLSGLLAEFDEPLDIPGVDENLLDELDFGDDSGSDNTDPDSVPEDVKPVVKGGELRLLGKNRVLCGDATKKEDVGRLMDDKKADMVFIDPPYGINVVKNRQIGGRGPVGGKKNYKSTIDGNNIVKANQYFPVHGDDKPFDPTFLFELADNLIIFGGNYFANKLPDSRGWLVWDKLDGMEGTTKNFSDFEMAWTSFDKPARLFRHRWQGLMKGSERDEKRVHPTQKPIQICIDLFEYYGEGLKIICDLFLGSGSTLIAAEKTNRICFGTEISEHYCTVILQRWADFTGKDPIREDGMKFSELKDSLKTTSPARGQS
jgi:hypothetical protein